jgi:hypothetical protein
VNKTRPAAAAAAAAAAVQKLALHTRRKSSKPSCAGPPTDQQQSRSAGAFLLPKFKWTSRNIAQVLHFTCLTCCGPVCDFRAVGYCLPVESSSQSSTVSCLQEIRKEKNSSTLDGEKSTFELLTMNENVFPLRLLSVGYISVFRQSLEREL